MNWKYSFYRSSIALAVGTAAMITQIELVSAGQNLTSPVNYNPPNRGGPGRTKDAGSRPACPLPAKPFTALAPTRTNWGETIDAHPTFWLYLPYKTGIVELILEDEQTKTIAFKTTFSVTNGTGVGQFVLPQAAPALEVDRLYRWQLSFVCNPTAQQAFQVNGIIVRRSPTPDLSRQLNQASPQQRINLFATNGFWYNALTEVAKLRRTRPKDATLASNWADLLQHPVVVLNNIVSEPLIDCCKLNSRP